MISYRMPFLSLWSCLEKAPAFSHVRKEFVRKLIWNNPSFIRRRKGEFSET